MEHISVWPNVLNFPNPSETAEAKADWEFWREILSCWGCRSKFYKRFKEQYPEIREVIFWEEVEQFFEGIHLTLFHIAEYLRVHVRLVIKGGYDEKVKFDKNTLHIRSHLLICWPCSRKYVEVEERITQENGKVRRIIKPSS